MIFFLNMKKFHNPICMVQKNSLYGMVARVNIISIHFLTQMCNSKLVQFMIPYLMLCGWCHWQQWFFLNHLFHIRPPSSQRSDIPGHILCAHTCSVWYVKTCHTGTFVPLKSAFSFLKQEKKTKINYHGANKNNALSNIFSKYSFVCLSMMHKCDFAGKLRWMI